MKKYVRGTYGDLMDIAIRTGNDGVKDLLRKCFQGWCNCMGKNPWDPQTIMEWRSQEFRTDADLLPELAQLAENIQ